VFPTDAGLVAVTPDQENAGWAMSPNQPCLPGNYCPFACPSGTFLSLNLIDVCRSSYGTMGPSCHIIHVSYQYGKHICRK
jgi:hypothetical protein